MAKREPATRDSKDATRSRIAPAGSPASAQNDLAEFARFMVDRATRSTIEAVASCAVDGCDRWRLFFDQGLADAISEESEYELEFFERLCGGGGRRGLPFAALIIDEYLTRLPRDRKQKLFDSGNLKRKGHPANLVFYGASFNTREGLHFLEIFKVFIKHGLTPEKVDAVAARCCDELERACNLAHAEFMCAVIPAMTAVPEELVKAIVARSGQAEKVIDILVNRCGVSLATFTDPRVLVVARPHVAEFIIALKGRTSHIFHGEPGAGHEAADHFA